MRLSGPAGLAGQALAALLLLLPPAAGGQEARPPVELLEVPRPALETLEEADRRQLEADRAALDRILADESSSEELVARAYGEIGTVYFLYDFAQPAEAALVNASALAPEEHDWHYYLGVLYSRDGRNGEARERLERAAELRPDHLPTYIHLGRVELDGGRLEAAEESFRAALAIDPESAAAEVGLGEIAQARGETAEAIERYRRALELQPRADSIHHRLGLAYRSAGDLPKAKEHLALNRGEPVRFEDPLVDGLTALLKTSAIHLARGNQAMMDGDAERAVAEYSRALERDPDDALVHYNLGMALIRAERREEALARLEHAVELDPDYRDAHYNLAIARAEDGRWAEAAEHFERAWRIDPLDQAARLDWALALEHSGDAQGAVRELTGLIEALAGKVSPVAGGAHLRLAALLEGRGGPGSDGGEEVLGHYRRAVELLPDSAEARAALAAALARTGRLDDAAAEYAAAVALDPAAPSLRFGQAMALILGGRHGDARSALESALADGSDGAAGADGGGGPEGDAALPLAHLLARLLATAPDPSVRDGARALALAGQVFEASPNLDHAETLAMAYAEVGNLEEAVAWQRRVLTRAESQGRPAPMLEAMRARLARYERGEPERSPWASEAPRGPGA
jgi:tetratricopeptide (TPR) repeat protein